MDKKSSKYSQPGSSKGAPAESKKNQDVVNGKIFPKTSRRREPPNINGSTKGEQSRKSGMQKTRSFDKRPKPKGQYHGSAKEDSEVVCDEAAELGSVLVPGSKKQNLNHLLKFHYESREVQGGSTIGRNCNRSSSNYNRWLPPVQRRKYNKELFLQANCQFVVSADGDYRMNLVDPDTLVEWKFIEQIKLHTSESLSCPICLGPPVAGKMTRCGHVYCWPCVLHYLSLSDKNWRKCPICYEPVDKSDLKSVVEITQYPLNIGDTVKLRLMRRKRGSLLAVPVKENETSDPIDFLSISENTEQIYSKLLISDIKDVDDIIENEREQLTKELHEDPHSPESCFIEQALNELSCRMENNHKQKNQENRQIENKFKDESNVFGKGVKNRDEVGADLPKFFYFYQAEDGQHVYLHAMNVKMLELQFGSLESSPLTITGRLLEKESGSFTEDLRRRLRYLCHLPLTCSFDVAEIEMTTLISEDIIGFFSEQMMAREKRRKKREKEEKRREKKINVEENKRMGRFPTPNVHIESHKHFPQWQPEPHSAGMGIPSPPGSVAASSVASSPSRNALDDQDLFAISTTDGSWPSQNDQNGPSFSQMLQNKNTRLANSRSWPSVGLQDISKISGTSGRSQRPVMSSGIDQDEYAVAPSHSQSFGDVLAQALEASAFFEDPPQNNKAKKKKRGKPTLLFASGMSRAD